MRVALVGSGPARQAVEAALGDVDVTVTDVAPDALDQPDLAVVVGQTGEQVFETVAPTVPWLAVEIGGLGGYPVVDAAVAGFETGCYDCLRTRVGANIAPNQEPQAAPAPETARFAGAIAGREAARIVAGERATVLDGVIEIPHEQRDVLPVPGCACGEAPDRNLDRTVVDRDTDESLGRAETALDDRVGPISQVGEAESFPVPYYLATLADTSGFSDATAARQTAGVDTDWNSAFMNALGEALERYCAGVYRTETVETATQADVENALDPGRFVQPSGDTPDPDVEIHWVPGEHLHSGDDVLVPAEFVWFPPPRERYRPAVTTGLGLGNGSVDALLSGLYEVIERDAAMLAWYSTFEPRRLTVEDAAFQELVTRVQGVDLTVTPLVLTQDIDVPVVTVAVHREAWPSFALGTSAHLDAATAARDALTEAIQNWFELRGMGRDGAAAESGAIGYYAEFPLDAMTFIDTEESVAAEQLGPDELPTGEAHLDAVLDRVRDAGLDAYGVRTTTRDVAALGFEAVRVAVPTAQPLFLDEPYFGERAESVPPALGFEPRLDRDHHPFP